MKSGGSILPVVCFASLPRSTAAVLLPPLMEDTTAEEDADLACVGFAVRDPDATVAVTRADVEDANGGILC